MQLVSRHHSGTQRNLLRRTAKKQISEDMVLSSDEDMPLDALCLTYEMNVRKIKFFFHIYRKKYIFTVKNLP